jgi:hypothetical protein
MAHNIAVDFKIMRLLYLPANCLIAIGKEESQNFVSEMRPDQMDFFEGTKE